MALADASRYNIMRLYCALVACCIGFRQNLHHHFLHDFGYQ